MRSNPSCPSTVAPVVVTSATPRIATGIWEAFSKISGQTTLPASLAAMITRTYRQERQRSQLFRQLLPICAECHKIRDDDGEWQQMEMYISENTGTDFSHGICPECAKQYYEAS